MILLQRSFRHAQLAGEARVDGKTGLLNAATWQREARTEVSRAVRTRTPLAVAMIDIDHFKAVNDTYGHLAGDAVLAGTWPPRCAACCATTTSSAGSAARSSPSCCRTPTRPRPRISPNGSG